MTLLPVKFEYAGDDDCRNKLQSMAHTSGWYSPIAGSLVQSWVTVIASRFFYAASIVSPRLVQPILQAANDRLTQLAQQDVYILQTLSIQEDLSYRQCRVLAWMGVLSWEDSQDPDCEEKNAKLCRVQIPRKNRCIPNE